jgi:hypothetical protein
MLTDDLKNTPPDIRIAIIMNTATYPAINNIKGYILFLYLDDHPDNRETAAMFVVNGHG